MEAANSSDGSTSRMFGFVGFSSNDIFEDRAVDVWRNIIEHIATQV